MTGTPIDVLHVEDNEAFSRLVHDHIQNRYDGISVHTVHDVGDALVYLEGTGDIDCVVSDYEMPGETGLELLAAVRDRWPDLPFILFTGKGSEEIAESAITAGVTDYLQKGLNTSQYAVLVNRIRNAVARYHAEIELRRASERTVAQFELLVDTVEDYAIFLLDTDGCIQTWNRGAERVKGYTRDEVVGEHVSLFYRAADIERDVSGHNLRTATTQGLIRDEGWRVRKDGSEFWANVTLTAFYEGDELAGYVKITRDSTSYHREQSLLEQERQLNRHLVALTDELPDSVDVIRENVELAIDTDALSRLDGALQGLDELTELRNRITELVDEAPVV